MLVPTVSVSCVISVRIQDSTVIWHGRDEQVGDAQARVESVRVRVMVSQGLGLG